MSIRRADRSAVRRRHELLSRRQRIYLVDRWLNGLESLMERGEAVVPEPLLTEITGFLGDLDADLSRRVHRKDVRRTSHLLEVLFEAQTFLLSRSAATA